MAKFADRLEELKLVADGVDEGGNVAVWMPGEMIDSLTALASEVGVTRSRMAKELLAIALPQAWEELRPDLKQTHLALFQAPVAKRTEKPQGRRSPRKPK